MRWKAIARVAGAQALLIIAQEEKFPDDRLAQLRYDNSAGEARVPVAVISRQTAAETFTATGDVYSALVDAAKNPNREEARPPSGRTAGLLLLKPNLTLSFSIDIVRQEVAATNVIGILEARIHSLRMRRLS